MGKSKKSKANNRRNNDLRWYNVGPTSSQNQQSSFSTSKLNVSKQTHTDLQSLVEQLQQNQDLTDNTDTSKTTTPSVVDEKRFRSKLLKIVNQLLDLGFQEQHLDQVVKELGYNITLEAALDYFCLHIPTLELPPILTDGNLRNYELAQKQQQQQQQQNENGDEDSGNLAAGTANPLTVLKFVSSQSRSVENDGADHYNDENQLKDEDNMLVDKDGNDDFYKEGITNDLAFAQQQQRLEQQQQGKDDDIAAREAAEYKSKILEQYGGYYSDGDGGAGEEQNDTKDEPVHGEKAQSLSPDELTLKEKQDQFEELQSDLNNDANNYMRSKQEIKQLQQKLKRFKQEIHGLERKIEKENRKQQMADENITQIHDDQEEEQEEEHGGNDLFGGGGFFGEADDNDDGEKAAVAEKDSLPTSDTTETIQKPLIDCVIPQSWTGTTPQKTLEEICRKKKLGKPKYVSVPGQLGCKLQLKKTTKTSSTEYEALTMDFVHGSSIQDYLALQALYDMDSTLPLYRLFPPSFRDIWLSWLQKEQMQQDKVQEENDAIKSELIDRLLSFIKEKIVVENEELDKTPIKEQIMTEKDIILENNAAVEDTWEDVVDDIENEKMKPDRVSSIGKKLKEEFVKRQSSPAYQNMVQQRKSLPMTGYCQEILDAVRRNSVLILCAETGAGKTTQCPQYILEDALLSGQGERVNIVCTQPRRVAATSVAERVAAEMADSLGNQVGYHIRMESKKSKDTKLLFCTTGVILRRLQEDRVLKDITHVIVDEVHERQVQTDVLLIALRQLLRTSRRDLKIILMSATMDSSLFSNFFDNAPVIRVPGRTFPVSSYFLEDLIEATGHVIEEHSQFAVRNYERSEKASLWVTTKGGEKRREVLDMQSLTTDVSALYVDYSIATRLSMERVDESILNYDLVEDVLDLLLIHPERNSTLKFPKGVNTSYGSLLVFLPGIGEIRSLTDRLKANRVFSDSSRFSIIPLHSKLSSADQRKAFLPAKSGCRKIIISTNIAETSVTIPDVVIVIDCGREREIRRNKRTSTSMLVTDWCSKANVKQRAGRAGRLQPGLCLKLFSSRKAEAMKPTSEPELKRVPLEEVCLSILASGMGKNCKDFLGQAPQPPTNDSIQAALTVLEEVGAITSSRDTLTPLGYHLAKLPVDVRLGKMLIFGTLFHCLDKVLTIAASLSSKSPFATFLQDAAAAKAKHRQFYDSDSDFATLCNVWDAYSAARSKSVEEGRAFCRSNFLNQASMYEIGSARQDFLNLLFSIGFISQESFSAYQTKSWDTIFANANSKDWDLIHSIVFAGLSPNVAQLKESKSGSETYNLVHRNEELFFHRSSVNAAKKRFSTNQQLIVFFDKFGTSNRVSISTTCFVNAMPILLFGPPFEIQYLSRGVLLDNWMEIEMAAQVAVLMRQLREQIMGVNGLLQKLVSNKERELDRGIIQTIIEILSP